MAWTATSGSEDGIYLGGCEFFMLLAILGLVLAMDLPAGAVEESGADMEARIHELSAPLQSSSASVEAGTGLERLQPTHRAIVVEEHPRFDGGAFVIELAGPIPPNARILILESIKDSDP